MKVIIPMSGKGKRFVEKGYTEPKPLIEVDGVPIIKHIIDLFSGEKNIHCICNREHLDTTNMRNILESFGATVHCIESHSLGPVYAVAQIFDTISDGEEVLVSYCDYGTVWNYSEFRKSCVNYDGIIAAYTGFHPHMLFGDSYAFLRNCGSDVYEVREKESFTDNKMDEYASNGTYYFKRGFDLKKYFKKLMDDGDVKNGEYYVSLVYNNMIRDGLKIGLFEIQKMLQWGTPRDLEIYNMWAAHFKHKAKPCSSIATLVLPMAGRGSRFSMVGYKDPKPLLPVSGKPMVVRAVEDLPQCQDKIFITLNEHLREYDLESKLRVEFADLRIIGIDEITLGQASTCDIVIQGLDPSTPIIISACDNGVDYDEGAYKALEMDLSIDVIVWSFDNNPTKDLYPNMYAWLDVDSDNNIRNVSVKKHFLGAKQAIIGTMFFRKAELFTMGYAHILKNNIRTNGEFYVDDLLNVLIEKGYNVKSFPVKNYICWGTPNDYKTYLYWEDHYSKLDAQYDV